MSDRTWKPIAALCNRLLDKLEEITDASTMRIREDLTDYALIPAVEHFTAVREQQRRRLEAFAERRPWSDTDLRQAVELAQRRARQGIPVDVLISAYHVGDRELWHQICSEASADPDAVTLLPDVASLMLESMQAISTTLASAHSLEARAQEGFVITFSQRLIDLLWGNDPGAEASRLAGYLGFVDDEAFESIVWRPDSRQDTASAHVQRLLQRMSGRIFYAQSTSDFVFLAQGTSPVAMSSLVAQLAEAGRVGVGTGHPGVGGAARSLEEARVALTRASDRVPVTRFDEDWFDACLTSHALLVVSVVARACEVARTNEGLRDTVIGFAEADMSIAKTARTMHLHANTVTYRLDRWFELTGWEARSFDGLKKSVVACILSDRDDTEVSNTGLRASGGS